MAFKFLESRLVFGSFFYLQTMYLLLCPTVIYLLCLNYVVFYLQDILFLSWFWCNNRNKQGSSPLDILKRMHADPGVTTLLQHLQEEELGRTEDATTAWERFSQLLRWAFRDVVRELGWRVTLLVVAVLCLAAWQLTVYLHGKSPFYQKHAQ